GISKCYGTIVAPSPRPSGRVPFGTGQSVANQLLDRDQPFVFYPSSPFKILGAWLSAVSRHVEDNAESIFAEALTIAPELARFLQQAGWQKTWTNLCRNHAQLDKRLHAFHCWFDSLKTLRLIHHLCATVHPKAEAELALPDLFKWAKLACPQGIAAKLAVLRHSQQVYK
ncbi:MAG: hypothetical protein JRF07_07830, partial [Deltaproteobacteria bacterium]|nr:hypothetical protein [Deltaproteobacteria bacterium]